jgi:hypothetical protein
MTASRDDDYVKVNSAAFYLINRVEGGGIALLDGPSIDPAIPINKNSQ